MNQQLGLFIVLNLFLLTTTETINFKHPHERMDDRLVAEFEKFENIRKLNADTVPYYQRLVKYLFRKQRFTPDPRSDDYFIANIPLKINKQQYELLINSDINGLNINELDSLVEEVMKQSNNDDWKQSITSILYEHYRQEIISSVTTFSSPILWAISSLIVLMVLNKIFHFSKLRFMTILFTCFFIICGISYYMTYVDCMHDLEVDMLMMLQKDEANENPCKKYHNENKSSWFNWRAFMAGSNKQECQEYLKKTINPAKKYCNPLEVFFKWVAKLQMSYFGSMFEEFTDFFSEKTSSMDIFSRSIAKIFYLAVFVVITIFIIDRLLRYIPTYFSHAASSTNHAQSSSIDSLSAKMDAILQENVEIKREISVIRERSEEPQALPALPPKKKKKLEPLKEAASSRSDDSTDDFS